MEEQTNTAISAFDSCFTTSRIQMMKILFSHLPREQQGGFAVYIKLMELLQAFHLMKNPLPGYWGGYSKPLTADFIYGDNSGSISLLQELLQFGTGEERTKIENMIQMMENMKKMQEMMDMIQMMQEMCPEGAGNMEQIFEMFGGLT